ncbi:hypothetical protein HMPREF9946_00466, partial [Acetobacteraceae bacterium AT-5844]
MSGEFWLTDRQWQWLAPLLPNKSRGVSRLDDRRVISGIIHVLRFGRRWVDAPASYGPRRTLYNRFVRWAGKGVWARLFQALAAADGPPAEPLLDSTHVKAHCCATGGKGGRRPRRSASAWTANQLVRLACQHRPERRVVPGWAGDEVLQLIVAAQAQVSRRRLQALALT